MSFFLNISQNRKRHIQNDLNSLYGDACKTSTKHILCCSRQEQVGKPSETDSIKSQISSNTSWDIKAKHQGKVVLEWLNKLELTQYYHFYRWLSQWKFGFHPVFPNAQGSSCISHFCKPSQAKKKKKKRKKKRKEKKVLQKSLNTAM